MKTHLWHHFLIQFFMLFHMVASVLLSMVAFSTILWLVKILQQPIRIFAMAVNRAPMENKIKATMWKSIKNWIRNRCHKWVYILFGVTCQKTNSELGIEVSLYSDCNFVKYFVSFISFWWAFPCRWHDSPTSLHEIMQDSKARFGYLVEVP